MSSNKTSKTIFSWPRMPANEDLFFLLLATFCYFCLREHPVSYDIGRHVETFLLPRNHQYSTIIPGVIDIPILRYGILSAMTPMSVHAILALFFILGWASFLCLIVAASVWSRTLLGKSSFGALLVLLIATLGNRQTLLFANHPYEIALHFVLSAFLYATVGRWGLAAGFSVLAGLIHPNTAGLVAGVNLYNLLRYTNLIRSGAFWLTLLSGLVLISFYLLNVGG